MSPQARQPVVLQLEDLLQGEDRDVLLVVLREIREGQSALVDRVGAVEKDGAETLAKLNSLILAFPGGDMEGHRRYHESIIEWRELRNKMVRAALEKAVGAGVLAGCGWIGYALWQAIKMEFKK